MMPKTIRMWDGKKKKYIIYTSEIQLDKKLLKQQRMWEKECKESTDSEVKLAIELSDEREYSLKLEKEIKKLKGVRRFV